MTESSKKTKPEDLLATWQQHVYAEFVQKDADAAVATMTDDVYVLLVPAGTGAKGKEAVRAFYADEVVSQIPADITATTISQAIGDEILIEESIQVFTHDIAMEWMIPGVPPTGRRVEVAVIGIIGFRAGLVAYERIYWDQASVLVQLGVLDAAMLSTSGLDGIELLRDRIKPGVSS